MKSSLERSNERFDAQFLKDWQTIHSESAKVGQKIQAASPDQAVAFIDELRQLADLQDRLVLSKYPIKREELVNHPVFERAIRRGFQQMNANGHRRLGPMTEQRALELARDAVERDEGKGNPFWGINPLMRPRQEYRQLIKFDVIKKAIDETRRALLDGRIATVRSQMPVTSGASPEGLSESQLRDFEGYTQHGDFFYRKNEDGITEVLLPPDWGAPAGTPRGPGGRYVHTVGSLDTEEKVAQFFHDLPTVWHYPKEPIKAANPPLVEPPVEPPSSPTSPTSPEASLDVSDTAPLGTIPGQPGAQGLSPINTGGAPVYQTVFNNYHGGQSGPITSVESGGQRSGNTTESARESYKVPEGKDALAKEWFRLDALEDGLHQRVRNGESGAGIADELAALKRQKNSVANTLFRDLDAQIVARKAAESAAASRTETGAARPEQNQIRQGTAEESKNAVDMLRIKGSVEHKFIAEERKMSETDVARWMSAPKRWIHSIGLGRAGIAAGLFGWAGKALSVTHLAPLVPAFANLTTQVTIGTAVIPLSAPAILGVVAGVYLWQKLRKNSDLHEKDALADAGWEAKKLEKGMAKWMKERETAAKKYRMVLPPEEIRAERKAQYEALQSKWKKVFRLQNVAGIVAGVVTGGYLQSMHTPGSVTEPLQAIGSDLRNYLGQYQISVRLHSLADCQNAIQELNLLPTPVEPVTENLSIVSPEPLQSAPVLPTTEGSVIPPDYSPEPTDVEPSPGTEIQTETSKAPEPTLPANPEPAQPEPSATEAAPSPSGAEAVTPTPEPQQPAPSPEPPRAPEPFPGVDLEALKSTFHIPVDTEGPWGFVEDPWEDAGFKGEKLKWLTDMGKDYFQGEMKGVEQSSFFKPGLLEKVTNVLGVTPENIPKGTTAMTERFWGDEKLFQEMRDRISQAPGNILNPTERGRAMGILRELFEGSQQLLKLRPSVAI